MQEEWWKDFKSKSGVGMRWHIAEGLDEIFRWRLETLSEKNEAKDSVRDRWFRYCGYWLLDKYCMTQ